MTILHRRRVLSLLPCIALSLGLGCSRGPDIIAPALRSHAAVASRPPGEDIRLPGSGDGFARHVAGRGDFFPLGPANRWQYDGRIVEETLLNGLYYRSERTYDEEDVFICSEMRDGHSYLVERQEQSFGSVGITQWVRVRQTEAGLFEGDVPTSEPPACDSLLPPGRSAQAAAQGERLHFNSTSHQAAFDRARANVLARAERVRHMMGSGTAGSDELVRLAYPLYVGARWVIRTEPEFTARVVAREPVAVPAGRMSAFKVRIHTELSDAPPPRRGGPQLLGPNDRVYFWVSRNGFLLFTTHLEAPITDEGGVILGQFTLNERRELTNYSIDRSVPGMIADSFRGVASATQ